MTTPYILGDWGTSSARFYLCSGGEILDTQVGKGIKFVDNAAAEIETLTKRWVIEHGKMNIVLSGMVGSTLGWKEAGYCDCPASLTDILSHLTIFDTPMGKVHIVPGVRTSEGLTGLPDVMRGEEVQVFGWAKDRPVDGLVCLPGTHVKWINLQNGHITNFVSSLNGELFSILAEHSILLGQKTDQAVEIGKPFRHGVEIGASRTSLNQLLFSARSLQLSGQYEESQARSYLLGLLIGSDVRGAFDFSEKRDVQIIGGQGPATFYAEAIMLLGGTAHLQDGQAASIAGLHLIHNYIGK